MIPDPICLWAGRTAVRTKPAHHVMERDSLFGRKGDVSLTVFLWNSVQCDELIMMERHMMFRPTNNYLSGFLDQKETLRLFPGVLYLMTKL